MITDTTFRKINGTVYVRIPPQYVEYFGLQKQIDTEKDKGSLPTCKVEDASTNRLTVIFPKWV